MFLLFSIPFQYPAHLSDQNVRVTNKPSLDMTTVFLPLTRRYFCAEYVVSFFFYVYFIYSSALKSIFYHGGKFYESLSDYSLGNNLIWVHIVCNIDILKHKTNIYIFEAIL